MITSYFGNKVDTMVIPDIVEVCYGRNVGYRVRKIEMSPEIEAISGTKIRGKK